jgi:cell division protein FtsZ
MGEDFTFLDPNGSNMGCDYHNIKVLGIGGCGNKALNRLKELGLKGPQFVAANTDPQDLGNCQADLKLLLGEKQTRKRGCGGNPGVGKAACQESLDSVKKALADADLVFIVAGLGGGTGSGGAPVVAEALAQFERPPLVVAVVTTPFSWEAKRHKIADSVLAELSKTCNSIITVANSNVEQFLTKECTVIEAMEIANDVLYKALAGIIGILNSEGRINLDFADIESVLDCRGPAFMAFGEASGENRARKALSNATTNPIMSEQSIKGAKSILVYTVSDPSFLLSEFNEINKLAAAEGAEDVNVFTGWAVDESLAETGTVKVTIIATGLDNSQAWDKSAEEVINLDTLADEPDVSVRQEAEAKGELASSSEKNPRRIVVDLGQAQSGASGEPGTSSPRSPARRAMRNPLAPPSQGQTGRQLSRYEKNAGVDPANNSDFYDTPSFFRNNAN